MTDTTDSHVSTNKTDKNDSPRGTILKGLKALGKFFLSILASGFKTIASFIFIILIFSFIGNSLSGSVGSSEEQQVHIMGEGPNKIVVVPLEGVILTHPQALSSSDGTITPDAVRKALTAVKDDSNVKGIILDIESPGGSAVASDQIFTIIQNFKKETKLPVVTLMNDTAASGGYFIAAATDKIVANPATLTGSIGVIATTFNVEEALGKLGVKEKVYKKGQYKDILSSFRDSTAEEDQIIDELLDDAYELFVDRVAQGRNMPREKALSLATGRVYSGRQAKEVGLVDTLGNLVEAIEETKSLAQINQAEVVRIQTGSFFDQLFAGISINKFLTNLAPTHGPRVWFLMQ